MAQERASRPMAGFFKFTELGDCVIGKIKESKNGTNGPFLILDYPMIRKGRKGKLEKYASVAVGIASDMRGKLALPGDIGQIVSLVYDDTEPTTKDSPKKIFRVLILSGQEYVLAEKSADKSKANIPYKAPEPDTNANGSDASEGPEDEEDDLPF